MPAAEQELCLNCLTSATTRNLADVEKIKAAGGEQRNDVGDEALTLIEFDERALDQDLVDGVQQIAGAVKYIELGTLHVDLQQARACERRRPDI
jgi:hypothetical protein